MENMLEAQMSPVNPNALLYLAAMGLAVALSILVLAAAL
jgi:hypothetical protein